jgi:hypothetical protein
MSEAPAQDRFKPAVYSVATAATLGFLGWVGLSVNGMSDRLTTIEVTMRENKAEREAQIADLRARVGRLEDERAFRNRSERERNTAVRSGE